MEKENKKNLIIGILIGIIIMLVLVILGLVVYKKLYLKEDISSNNHVTEKQEDNNKEKDEEPEKIVLDEEDVKKWLNDNILIERYFILKENDYNYYTADVEDYSKIISSELVYGSTYKDGVIDIKELPRTKATGYDWQYTYDLDYIERLLNNCFNVEIDKIDINIMNNINKEIGNYSIVDDKFVVKYRLYLENSMKKEIVKISLENDEIIIKYKVIMQGDMPEYDSIIGYRELVLKKTSNGYNLLKAYKVES